MARPAQRTATVKRVGPARRIRADLGQLAPGPELARALSEIELSALCHSDVVEVLEAEHRQANHQRGRVLAAMAETGLCAIGPDDDVRRLLAPDEFAADEVRVALALTRAAAEGAFFLAYDLRERLPAVQAAMLAGRCDEPRARIFCDWTAGLADVAAHAVCAALLLRVDQLTTGQLIEAIKTRAIAADPDWARRRYEEAVAGRKVVARRNPDGSANLAGYDLPVDRVARAAARIDALTKAAKAAGDARRMDYIRAELFLGMTDGSYVGLGDEIAGAEGWAVACRPAAPTSITRTTTRAAGRPPRPTSVRCVAMTTGSSTRAAGHSSSPSQDSSSGPAGWASATTYVRGR